MLIQKDVILKNNVHEAAIPEINPDVPEAPVQPDITRVTTANDTQAAGSKMIFIWKMHQMAQKQP